jgi:hypothetical protein
MSRFLRYLCRGCGTRFNDPCSGYMHDLLYPVCPTCGTDYYVTEPGE